MSIRKLGGTSMTGVHQGGGASRCHHKVSLGGPVDLHYPSLCIPSHPSQISCGCVLCLTSYKSGRSPRHLSAWRAICHGVRRPPPTAHPADKRLHFHSSPSVGPWGPSRVPAWQVVHISLLLLPNPTWEHTGIFSVFCHQY